MGACGVPKELSQLDLIREPIQVNSVAVDKDGMIERRTPKIPFCFSFQWRGSVFEGRVQQAGSDLSLKLSTRLGVLPYTAENAGLRDSVLGAIEQASEDKLCGVSVTDNQAAMLTREVPIASSAVLTASALVTNIAVAVLGAAPYLDLLSGFGLQPARR